ncbi:MAG: phosphate/phosphite/phosphonate ABC transporter substrate-binding protein [Thermodesulfovibrionales bacterium]
MRKRLEFKILSIVIGLLIIGNIAAAIMAVSIQKKTIHTLTTSANNTLSGIVLKNIETTMLEGKADITLRILNNIKDLKSLEGIAVYDLDGREAFKPASPASEAQALKELKSGAERIIKKEGYRHIFYMPLKNHQACQRCHGAEKPILGALKITISTEKESKEAMSMISFVIVATVIASVAFAFLLWTMLRRMVLSPVKEIERAASRIADGDLTFDIKVESEDEIGSLVRNFKESFRSLGGVLQRIKGLSDRIMKVTENVENESKNVIKGAEIETEAINNISLSVSELNSAATEISDNTETLAASIEETSASMEQMASSIGSINENIHELHAAVESTSSSIEQLSATIKQVATNAEDLASASEETLSAISEITSTIKEVEMSAKESARLSEKVNSDAATLGMASIEKTIEGMKNIKSSVERTAELIRKLGGRSDEIGKILTVIDEVTDQTTLLALNAAILAAQAGEHGKGFSVVADEIKDLAERTAFSTQEISALIQSVQSEVKSAVEAMQEGLSSVDEGFRLAREAGDSLSKILESSKRSSEMAMSIERSTTEQSKAARLVTEAMERVKNMTEQIAKATSEQSKGILLIMKATEKIRDVSLHLTKATEEQAISSKQISQAMEIASDRSQQISKALSEHKIGTRHILNTIDGIKGVPENNRNLAFKINNKLRELYKDTELLKAETERFMFYEEKGVVIRFGVVPLESPAIMFKKFSPLTEYLSRKLGRPVDLRIAVDFEGAIKDIGQNITQLCYMTPSTYIEANKRYGVKVFAKALRDGKPYHHSVIITRNDSDLRSIEDLKGRTFAFGDMRSTSSHIIPRAMLKQAGIDLTDLKYYNYLGHHDDVIKAVLKGEYDAGGVMESTAYKFKDKGIRFLKLSDEIPEFNICYNPSLSEGDLSIIRTALITLKDTDPEGATILKSIDESYTGFTEAKDSDYEPIRTEMARIGMI